MSKVQKKQPAKTDQISTNDALSMQLDSPLKICDKTGSTVKILEILNFKSAKSMSIDDVLDARKFFNLSLISFDNSTRNHRITEFNSAIQDCLDAFPVIKDYERQMFEKILRTKVKRDEERVAGLYRCTFTVAPS